MCEKQHAMNYSSNDKVVVFTENITYNKIKSRGARNSCNKKEVYTISDIYDLPDGKRVELIDGQIRLFAGLFLYIQYF